MRFLVTGGCGFIGRNIAQRLLNCGHDVTVLDDLSLGTIWHSESIRGRDYNFIGADIRDVESVTRACKGVDGVFHEAAWSSAPMFERSPKEGISVNLQGFANVVEACAPYKIPVVYATTSSLYSAISGAQEESVDVTPGSFYEYTFFAREKLAKLYADLGYAQVCGLRYFSVYGPGESQKGRYANLITQFLLSHARGEAPVIYYDGLQQRDFIYVGDVVEANFLAMGKLLQYGIRSGQVYNVGTGDATSINGMHAMVQQVTKTQIEPKYVDPEMRGYVTYTCASTEKAKRDLNFEANVSLKEGIEMTWYYLKEGSK
jgi:nucleoside-diphosphate-sugar epimerase